MQELPKLWELYPQIWKTESSLMSWLRGGIRRSLWNRHPIKLEFIRQNRVKIPNPNPRGKVKEVWGGVCSISGEMVPLKDLEVDHKTGNHSLRSIDDVQSFIQGIVFVTLDDLAFVSKEMHRVKSYCEKQGISFEQGKAEKKAISLIKNKEDRSWLVERGITPASTCTKRRQQIIEELLK